MCGIGGIVWRKKESILYFLPEFEKCLIHRGPDDKGYLLFQNNKIITFNRLDKTKKVCLTPPYVLLLHRRLSIIDLSKLAHQPMSYNNGRLWIIYNGEIYNYVELREELRNKGYTFKTNSDTEVILASYAEWGNNCVQKFNGMWSFVILDTEKNILFGSRDRLGVKPLYFSISNDFFIFSSEIKALLCFPFLKKEINPKAVFYYLMFDLEEGEEEGFIKGIYELLPSFSFEYDLKNHTLKKWRYYKLSFNPNYTSFKDHLLFSYLKDVREKIFNAVRIRLRSDVPIGSCLSGGIDSSTIVCVIDKLLKEGPYPQASEKKLFTAIPNLKEIDESKWAKIVVSHIGGKWCPVYINEKHLINDLEDLIYTQDIPFGSLSVYAQYCVMKKAKEEGIKVMMDGQGADELFTGYISYYLVYMKELVKNNIFDALRELFFLRNSPFTYKDIKYVLKSIIQKASPYAKRYKLISRYINKELLVLYKEETEKIASIVTGYKATSLNHMLFIFMTGPRLKTLLRYEDRNSMRFSIEARTPFSDDIELIETVFSIPSVYKIRNGWSKFLLRKSMNGIVPSPILKRREKIGFATPEYIWLKKLKPIFLEYLDKDVTDFINVKLLKKEWDLFLDQQPNIGITGLWRFINFSFWKKLFSL